MDGLYKITYKDKEIFCVDFSKTEGSKEKTLQLIKAWEEEFIKYPPQSIITLSNVTGLKFDTDILNAIKNARNKTASIERKSALYGMSPIHKAAYNFLLAISAGSSQKVFNTEEEAKQWLVKD